MKRVVDWHLIDKTMTYLLWNVVQLMIWKLDILINHGLRDLVNSQIYMTGIDISDYYEGYADYKTEDL